MVEKVLTVRNKDGLHARPAAIFVRTASQFSSEITISSEGKQANAKSILGVLSLGATKGTTITLRATGSDEEAAVAALAGLLEGDLDEVV